MKKIFKEKVLELILLQKELSETSKSKGLFETDIYGSEIGLSVDEDQLSHLMEEFLTEDFISDKEVIENAKNIMTKRSVMKKEELKKSKKEFDLIENKISIIQEEIKDLYSKLDKSDVIKMKYQTFLCKHLTDSELITFQETLTSQKVNYVLFGGKICIVYSDQFDSSLLILKDIAEGIYSKYVDYSQPVKFNGYSFDKRLSPLISLLIK